jgi:hypothetical protein
LLLNNQWLIKQISGGGREKFPESYENEIITYHSLLDTEKAVLRE